jgi:predicted ATPase
MITRLVISNYRSLGRGVELDLGPLTALVGPNGSGKSNVVDVLRFVGDAMRLGLEGAISKRHGIRAIRRWSPGHELRLRIRLEVESSDFSAVYEFVITGGGDGHQVGRELAEVRAGGEEHSFSRSSGIWEGGPTDLRPRVDAENLALPLLGGDERFKPLAELLGSIEVYSIFPDVLREPQKYDPAKPMKEHGTNWLSILKEAAESDWKDDLVTALNQLTSDISDLEVTTTGGYLIAQFKHGNAEGKWFDAAQESDGTLRVAGILTALLQSSSPSVIGIEEPELTVHPGALPLLCDFIQEASRQRQVIFTTHSPDLLDQLGSDEIRVVERREGVTTVEPIDEDQRIAVRDRLLTLGEVLRIEGLKQRLRPSA